MLFIISVVALLFSGDCLATFPSAPINEIEGCNEIPNKDPKRLDKLSVADFEFNNAKPLEVFRLRMVFRGDQPAIGISYNKTEFVFGSYNDSYTIYTKFEDFFNQTNPTVIRGKSTAFSINQYAPMILTTLNGKRKAFSSTKFTPMELVLTKGSYSNIFQGFPNKEHFKFQADYFQFLCTIILVLQ